MKTKNRTKKAGDRPSSRPSGNGKMTCRDAGRELASKHTSRSGRALAHCVGSSCSSAGWELSVLGSSDASRRLRKCGGKGKRARRDNPGARRLSVVAGDIKRHWKDPYYGAEPYIRAMSEMDSADDSYENDSGREIILRFLGNAGKWRGPEAKRIKNELRAMVGMKTVPNPNWDGDEDDETRECPMCGGRGSPLGELGTRRYYRCRQCAWEWSVGEARSSSRARASTSTKHSKRDNPGRMGSHGYEYVTLDGNMSDRTVEKLKGLIRERVTDDYPIHARDSSEEAGIFARRGIDPSGSDRQGKLRFLISPKRMVTLLPSLLRSRSEKEKSMGNTIATTLDIEVV